MEIGTEMNKPLRVSPPLKELMIIRLDNDEDRIEWFEGYVHYHAHLWHGSVEVFVDKVTDVVCYDSEHDRVNVSEHKLHNLALDLEERFLQGRAK